MLARILAFLSAALRGLAGFAGRLIRLPGSLIGALLGGGGGSQVPPPPADDDARQSFTPPGCEPDVWARRLASYAYSRQRHDLIAPPVDVPLPVRHWAGMLEKPELLALAEAGPERILEHVAGKRPIDGVPPVVARRSEVIRWRKAHTSRLVALAREEVALLHGDDADPARLAAIKAEMNAIRAGHTRQVVAAQREAVESYEALVALAR